MKYDYFLTGASGQVGRNILRNLVQYGTVAIVMRRSSLYQAQQELKILIGNDTFNESEISIYLGDILDIKLPVSKEIFHAAATTEFRCSFNKYWEENVMSTIKLSQHANTYGAHLHLMSSISVAQCRTSVLTENDMPILHKKQSNYTWSKGISEHLAFKILPQDKLSIYRISDLVPSNENIEIDFRRNHWLVLLLNSNSHVLKSLPDDYEFYLVSGNDLSKAIVCISQKGISGIFHLFGLKYKWKEVIRASMNKGSIERKNGIAKYIKRKIFVDPSIATLVDDKKTMLLLNNLKVRWKSISPEYWEKLKRKSSSF